MDDADTSEANVGESPPLAGRMGGYGPVKWGHHPDLVKTVIRKAHFRPLKKACYENCGRFLMHARRQGRSQPFEYAEGWIQTVGVYLPHAWLIYHGEVVDLTIPDTSKVIYCEHRVMTPKQVAEEMLERGRFGPFLDCMEFAPEQMREAMAKAGEQ